MPTFAELVKAASMAHWTVSGDRQLVKVVSAYGYDNMRQDAQGDTIAGGYITEKRYLWGLDNRQIEKVLGLRPFELKHIAYVFELAEVPAPDAVAFKYATAFPDGESVFDGKGGVTAEYADAKAQAAKAFAAGKGSTRGSYWPVVDHYPMGSAMVPQWQIKRGAEVKVRGLLGIASPHQPFARDNGSTKPYTPHNKGPIKPI